MGRSLTLRGGRNWADNYLREAGSHTRPKGEELQVYKATEPYLSWMVIYVVRSLFCLDGGILSVTMCVFVMLIGGMYE